MWDYSARLEFCLNKMRDGVGGQTQAVEWSGGPPEYLLDEELSYYTFCEGLSSGLAPSYCPLLLQPLSNRYGRNSVERAN